MLYVFAGLSLDPDRVELRRAEEDIPLEPQVFALLHLLVENHDRMVSRDEIVEKIWKGRAISESALSSRVKSLRRAIGDDGARQDIVRTLRGRGFRCVAEVRIEAPPPPAQPQPAGALAIGAGFLDPLGALGGAAEAQPAERPSLAVLPFHGGEADPMGLGEGLAQEVIITLARQRDLFVISRASSFRFRERDPDIVSVGQALGVRYCITGQVRSLGERMAVTVELAATAGGEVLWSHRFDESASAEALETVTAEIANSVEIHIAVAEARRARHWQGVTLDAWSSYHVGLSRMYRFNRSDNAAATRSFEAALARRDDFARAHAGLSFTAFQDVFAGYAADVPAAVRAARLHGERAVDADPLDPFAVFNLGRAFWLEGEMAGSRDPLDQALHLSPSFAKGYYARAIVHAWAGETADARDKLDRAIALSPLDPFLYAFRGIKAMTHVLDGRPDLGVPLIDAAAVNPLAHPVVSLVAGAINELSGNAERGRLWVERATAAMPGLTSDSFRRAFPFVEPGLLRQMLASLGRSGLR